MAKQKIILLILLGLVIAAGFFSAGIYFATKYREPKSVLYPIYPGEKTAVLKDWQVLLQGQIKELSPLLVLTSEGYEMAVELSNETVFYSLSQKKEGEEIQEPTFNPITFQDLKIGDTVSVTCLLEVGGKMITKQIVKLEVE